MVRGLSADRFLWVDALVVRLKQWKMTHLTEKHTWFVGFVGLSSCVLSDFQQQFSAVRNEEQFLRFPLPVIDEVKVLFFPSVWFVRPV